MKKYAVLFCFFAALCLFPAASHAKIGFLSLDLDPMLFNDSFGFEPAINYTYNEALADWIVIGSRFGLGFVSSGSTVSNDTTSVFIPSVSLLLGVSKSLADFGLEGGISKLGFGAFVSPGVSWVKITSIDNVDPVTRMGFHIGFNLKIGFALSESYSIGLDAGYQINLVGTGLNYVGIGLYQSVLI